MERQNKKKTKSERKKMRSKRKDKRMVITRSGARRRQCCAIQEGKMWDLWRWWLKGNGQSAGWRDNREETKRGERDEIGAWRILSLSLSPWFLLVFEDEGIVRGAKIEPIYRGRKGVMRGLFKLLCGQLDPTPRPQFHAYATYVYYVCMYVFLLHAFFFLKKINLTF